METGKRQPNKKLIAIILAALLFAGVCAAVLIPALSRHGDVTAMDETPAPTAAVTAEPNAIPTAEPTPVLTAEPTPEPTEGPTPEPTEEPVFIRPPETRGMVACAKNISYGLSSCGLLSYIGRTNGRASCYDWRDIRSIACSSSFTVGLTGGGKVLVSGNYSLASKTSSWSGAARIACTENAVYALTADGTLLSTDGTASGRLSAISACGSYLAGITAGGSIVTFGAAPDVSALEGLELTAVSAGPTHILAITADELLVSTRADEPYAGTRCTRVFAGNGFSAYIGGDGALHTDCPFIAAQAPNVQRENGAVTAIVANCAGFAASDDHALVLFDSGTVTAFGASGWMQTAVGSWRLTPYMTAEGYVLGIAPGEKDAAGSVIRTGSGYTLPSGARGTAVILGDVDADGQITDADYTLLKNYLAGSASLSSAQKQAANVLRDAKKPGAIDRADAEQLRYHLAGYTVIDQYAKSFTYSGEVADAERVNTDACGYIRMANTNISAPIMYGKDFYYHYHSPTGAESSNGSIYLYYNYPSRNTVITGHNLRKSGTMLHDLHKLQDHYAGSYGTFSKRVYSINLFGETGLYEVFSMYEEKPNDPDRSSQYYNCNYSYKMESMTDAQIREWISYQNAHTQLSYTLAVDPTDRFLTILTCADTHAESNLGGRIYFFLRRIDGH